MVKTLATLALGGTLLFSGCDNAEREKNNKEITHEIKHTKNISFQQAKVEDSYDYFRAKNNLGMSIDNNANTAAIITLASSLEGGNSYRVGEIYDYFRAKNNLGMSIDNNANTAAILTLSTIISEKRDSIFNRLK